MTAEVAGPVAPETLRRDQRERRERIVRAALRSLVGNDYARVKVSEVARDSGVALGTLYRYFTSKEHLFAAAFLEWQLSLKRQLDRLVPAGETEEERVRDVLHRTVRGFQLQPQFYRVLMVIETTSDPYVADIFGKLEGTFVDIVRSAFGDADPLDADHWAIFHTLTGVLNGELRSWIMGRRTIDDVYRAIDDAIRLIYEFTPRP